MKPQRHHIRKWSQAGRTKEGRKVQTFCFECSPCKVRLETTSRSKREREVEAHVGA